MNTILKKISEYKVLIIGLLLLGTFFRAYMPELYVFGFDQVQILTNAEMISEGNLTLIGPRTGPADMFTGPLVYYIAAFFIFLVGSPWAIVGMSTLISLVTGIMLYVLSKKYLSNTKAFIITFLWAFSPFLIHFDRIAWNPNLSLLSSALVFFPLLGIFKKDKVTKLDLLYIAAGSFLGFQAHFSGLILPFMVVLSLLVFRKLFIKPVVASGIGLFLSILPSILFDARNGWLNSKGLINFVSEKESVGGTLFADRFMHSLKTMFEIFGSLIPIQIDRQVSIYLGLLFFVLVLFLFIKKRVSNRINISLSLVWLFTIVMLFSLYRSNSPEYYFFILLPAGFISLSEMVEPFFTKKVFKKDLLLVILPVLALYIVSNFTLIAGRNPLKIKNQLAMAQDISFYQKNTPVSKLAYDILEVDTLGMRYFNDKIINLSEEGRTIHIAESKNQLTKYDNYGLWIDPRTNTDTKYLVANNLVIQTRNDISVLKDNYQGDKFGPFEVFKILQDNQLTGDALVIVEKIDNPFITGNKVYKELKDSAGTNVINTDWKTISQNDYVGYLREYENYGLVFITDKDSLEFQNVAAQIIDVIDITPNSL